MLDDGPNICRQRSSVAKGKPMAVIICYAHGDMVAGGCYILLWAIATTVLISVPPYIDDCNNTDNR